MLKEAANSLYYDYYKENLFYLEEVIENLLERVEEIDKRREERGERRLSDNIRYRIKSPESMMAKLKMRGLDTDAECGIENLCDAAGIRIICPYLDDVYTMASEIAKCSDIMVEEVKDYIKKPKKNGYRSYHMIVKMPIRYQGRTIYITCEIQIRTMVMNSWASAEHQLRYKNDAEREEGHIEMLRKCADEMLKIDESMMKIRDMMESSKI